MSTLIVAALSFVGFLVAYHTYGRWLGRRIFGLTSGVPVPSHAQRDDVDYVPTHRGVVFGHHFTSIAGTGPIVGPAIAVFWGWLPALLWVLVGSVFIGAVHDFGALVVSLRSRGQSIGQAAGHAISPRARMLFFLILLLELAIVLAVFGLVIATIFSLYPECILSVWVQLPMAVGIGWWVYKRRGGLFWPALAALAVMYAMVYVGTLVPVDIRTLLGFGGATSPWLSNVVIWTLILLVYCFFASVLPVWSLLQPRDCINSHQLLVAMGLLVVGLAVAGLTGSASVTASAPAIAPASQVPADAPPLVPFLFITIACGAVSGFHALVSSGTSSKQLSAEPDARMVGYGAMLVEGALAVIVLLACTAGLGMGDFQRTGTGADYSLTASLDAAGQPVVGQAAFAARYGGKATWAGFKLKQTLGAFVDGGANFLTAVGIPLKLAVGILAVLVASFAATTLDTATRLQRYVIEELAAAVHVRPLTNRYAATALAVLLAGALALFTGAAPGTGGMILWPVFGATNQLLAGLVFGVIGFFLLRRGKPVWFLLLPGALMLVLPAWAMLYQMLHPVTGWLVNGKWLLFGIGAGTQVLMVWLVIEGVLAYRRLRSGIELPLPDASAEPAVETVDA